jgi:hypothetical protein
MADLSAIGENFCPNGPGRLRPVRDSNGLSDVSAETRPVGSVDRLEQSSGGQPLQVCVGGVPGIALAAEEVVSLREDEGVRAARTPGLVRDGEFGPLDSLVNVVPALLGEGPLQDPAFLVGAGLVALLRAAPSPSLPLLEPPREMHRAI